MESGHDTSHTESLLRAAGLGDRAALSELIETHRDYLRRVIDLRMDPALRGRVDPSDIVQETHMVASNRLSDFVQRRPASFKLWLRGEAIQHIGAQYRRHVKADRRSVRRECSISDASSMMLARGLLAGAPSKIAAEKEMAQRVRELVEDLPEIDREILLLRYFQQLEIDELATALRITRAAADQRLTRARQRLTCILETLS